MFIVILFPTENKFLRDVVYFMMHTLPSLLLYFINNMLCSIYSRAKMNQHFILLERNTMHASHPTPFPGPNWVFATVVTPLTF